MSFGDGNLHEECEQLRSAFDAAQDVCDEWAKKADAYRRQLGGMTAAHNRAKQRIAELEALVRHMAACIEFGGWPCNDCPYEDHECEKEWYEAMKRLGV